MPGWTLDDAAPVVEAADAVVQPHAFRAQMVCSVATYASSEKGLGVTVAAQGSTSVEDLLAAIAAIEKLYRLRDVTDDVLGFQDDAGRTIEVWLCNVPHGVFFDDDFNACLGQLVTLSPRQLELRLRRRWPGLAPQGGCSPGRDGVALIVMAAIPTEEAHALLPLGRRENPTASSPSFE